jgi:hypothetical protein
MTALHRRWLDTGDVTAREKISVLNLRRSLSTALATGLDEAFGWLASPEFTALLEDSDAA